MRGGFGNAFRRIVCVIRDKPCRECLLKGKCVYSYVFEIPPPEGTQIMRKYGAAPHPFVIEPPLERKKVYKPGEALDFGLVLIGRAVDYLDRTDQKNGRRDAQEERMKPRFGKYLTTWRNGRKMEGKVGEHGRDTLMRPHNRKRCAND